jgi:hypothetical protein
MPDPAIPHLLRAYVEPAPSPTDPADADHLYRALGVALIAWGRLEGHFFLILITIVNVARHKRIPRKPPMKWDRQKEVWQIAFEWVPSLARQEIEAGVFITKMDALSQDRNNIIHGLWELFNPGDRFRLMSSP